MYKNVIIMKTINSTGMLPVPEYFEMFQIHHGYSVKS